MTADEHVVTVRWADIEWTAGRVERVAEAECSCGWFASEASQEQCDLAVDDHLAGAS